MYVCVRCLCCVCCMCMWACVHVGVRVCCVCMLCSCVSMCIVCACMLCVHALCCACHVCTHVCSVCHVYTHVRVCCVHVHCVCGVCVHVRVHLNHQSPSEHPGVHGAHLPQLTLGWGQTQGAVTPEEEGQACPWQPCAPWKVLAPGMRKAVLESGFWEKGWVMARIYPCEFWSSVSGKVSRD